MIKLFSKKDCAKCQEIKDFMKNKKVEFIELSADIEQNLEYLIMEDVDISELPIIEKNGKFFTNKTTGLTRAILHD